jgi:hypothetical protein
MDFNCKIYVNARVSLDELLAGVATVLGGSLERWTVEAGGLEVSGDENDEFDELCAADGVDEFLFFPYRLEVEPTGRYDDQGAFDFLVRLLAGLEANDFDFVTAGEVEAQLPNAGRSRA